LFRRAMRTCEPARTAVWRTDSGLLCARGQDEASEGGGREGGGARRGGRKGGDAPLADLVLLEGPDLGLVHLGLVGDGERGAVASERWEEGEAVSGGLLGRDLRGVRATRAVVKGETRTP